MTEAALFVGGRVYTGRRRAEALLVENGRVLAVGAEGAVRREAPVGVDRQDLAGGLVVPGPVDAHLHLGELARQRAGVDASAAASVPELAAALARRRAERPDAVVVGRGIDPERLAEKRWPTPEELDAAVPDVPVILYHASGHGAVLNSAALARLPEGSAGAGVPRSGRLPGVLLEAELRQVESVADESAVLTPEALERELRELAALGLTAVGAMNVGRRELELLRTLAGGGRLPLKVFAYPGVGLWRGIPPGAPSGSERLRLAGFKGLLDGAFGPRTASLQAPYADDPSGRGIDREDDPDLGAAIARAREEGVTPALHAIGDRAVERAVRLLAGAGPTVVPGRIEHASLTPPHLWGPLRRLGAWLVVQPGFLRTDRWLPARLGAERVRWAYAFRTLADLGIPLAGSSDAPFDSADPWRGMAAAVLRADDLGRSANPRPEEALTHEEALGLYTVGARRALGDAAGGLLEVGSPADLVVLDVPRLRDAVLAGGAAVRETWVEGRRSAPHRPPGV